MNTLLFVTVQCKYQSRTDRVFASVGVTIREKGLSNWLDRESASRTYEARPRNSPQTANQELSEVIRTVHSNLVLHEHHIAAIP
jgi:hypothetical protein